MTGCGHSAAHYPRSPRRAWLQEAVRDGRLPCGSALWPCWPRRHPRPTPVRPTGGGLLRPERGVKAARPFPVGQERSRPPEAGYSLPRSRSPIKETRRGKATVIAPEAAHCSHAYLDKALVITGEAIVSSRRQDPRRWGRPVNQVAGSRRDQPAGGTQQPAEKPASVDTDGWGQLPVGLPLYPRGVGLYKPPGAPMQRVRLQA